MASVPTEPKRDQPRTVRWLIDPVSGGKSDWALAGIASKTFDLPVPEDLFLPRLARQGFCR